MSRPGYIPLATLLGWAREAPVIPESVLVVARMQDGHVEVGNSGEEGPAIVALLREAADTIERSLRPRDPCDRQHLASVRQSTDNEAMSHGGSS